MNILDDEFSKIVGLSIKRWSSVQNLKNIAKMGLNDAEQTVTHESKIFIDILLSSQEMREELINDGINPDEFVKGLPENIAKKNLDSFKSLIDASSLIFAHSIIDYTTFEYCKITFKYNPNYWEKLISDKKVSINELKEKGRKEIIHEKLAAYFNLLERESLLTKIDHIFSICHPEPNFQFIDDYKFNRDRIKNIDRNRHDIIHSNMELEEINLAEDDIYYLQFTDFFLWALIKRTFNLEIDRYKMFN